MVDGCYCAEYLLESRSRPNKLARVKCFMRVIEGEAWHVATPRTAGAVLQSKTKDSSVNGEGTGGNF